MGSRNSYAIGQKCALKPSFHAVAGAVSVYHLVGLVFFFILSLSCYSAMLWSVAVIDWNKMLILVLNYIKNTERKEVGFLILINMKYKACSLAGMLHHAKWHLLHVSVLKGSLGITLRSSNTNPPWLVWKTSVEACGSSEFSVPSWPAPACEFGLLLSHIFQCSPSALLHARNLTIMVFTCFEISWELLRIGIGFMSGLL